MWRPFKSEMVSDPNRLDFNDEEPIILLLRVSNETGNLQYLGIENVKGNRCHKWNAVGLKNHPNYYYQYVASGLPCEVDGLNYLRKPTEKADDQYIFDEASFKFSLRQGYFQVPRICKSVKNCRGSVCYNPEAYHNVQMTA